MVDADYIYLDYAATAPLCEEAVRAMSPYRVPGKANIAAGANANSLHSAGRAAFEAMEDARRSISHLLGATRPDEIVFTSGATESDNAALIGLACAMRNRRQRNGRHACPRVVTSAIEHDAVLESAQRLESQGFCVTYVRPNKQGFIEAETLRNAMDEDTVLVSIQMANSEVGSVQPIAEFARIAHEYGALFHTDAVQTLGKIPVDLEELGVDSASFSAHKIGGPKGVGLLYLRARTPFEPQMLGGGQENGRRSGTQNVCGIVGMQAALLAATQNLAEESVRLCALRDNLYERLRAYELLRPTVNVRRGSFSYLPNIVHVLAHGFESETLILRLDMHGIGVSGGSACSSRSLGQSHVLKAMGITGDDALGALRVSIGRYTTEQDIEALLAALPACLDS